MLALSANDILEVNYVDHGGCTLNVAVMVFCRMESIRLFFGVVGEFSISHFAIVEPNVLLMTPRFSKFFVVELDQERFKVKHVGDAPSDECHVIVLHAEALSGAVRGSVEAVFINGFLIVGEDPCITNSPLLPDLGDLPLSDDVVNDIGEWYCHNLRCQHIFCSNII